MGPNLGGKEGEYKNMCEHDGGCAVWPFDDGMSKSRSCAEYCEKEAGGLTCLHAIEYRANENCGNNGDHSVKEVFECSDDDMRKKAFIDQHIRCTCAPSTASSTVDSGPSASASAPWTKLSM